MPLRERFTRVFLRLFAIHEGSFLCHPIHCISVSQGPKLPGVATSGGYFSLARGNRLDLTVSFWKRCFPVYSPRGGKIYGPCRVLDAGRSP